jgi:hypothetical protein
MLRARLIRYFWPKAKKEVLIGFKVLLIDLTPILKSLIKSIGTGRTETLF